MRLMLEANLLVPTLMFSGYLAFILVGLKLRLALFSPKSAVVQPTVFPAGATLA